MEKKYIVIFFLFLSIISFGKEFKGSYEEGYIEININKKIKYSFFPVYMDYSQEEPYIGMMNFFALIMAKGMKIDRKNKTIYGKMGYIDYKFYYGDTEYIDGEGDIYIRGTDLSQVFEFKEYNWSTETYSMKIKTKFKTPSEIYLEEEKKIRELGTDGKKEIKDEDVYYQKRKFFTPGAVRLRYINNGVEDLWNEEINNNKGNASVGYNTQMLYGDFTTTGFVYPDSSLGYTALKYNEILDNKSIIVGDVYMQTYDFLGSNTLTGIAVQDWNGTGDIEVGQTSIRGFASYNSTVELYRNGSLYRFAKIGKDGFYEFENINIQGYSDIYTIKIYNFDGSIEVRQVSMMSGNKILKKNKIDYSFLVGTHTDMNGKEAINIEEKEVEGNIKVSYGLTNNLTIGTEYINNLTEEGGYNYPQELIGLDLYYTTGAVKYPTYFQFSEVYDLKDYLKTEDLNTHIGKIRQRIGGDILSLEGYMYGDFLSRLKGYENRYLVNWSAGINKYWGYNLTYDNLDYFGYYTKEIGSAEIYRNKGGVSHELGISSPFLEKYGDPEMYYHYSNNNIEIFKTNLNFILKINSDLEEFEDDTNLRIALKTRENKKKKIGIYAKYNSKNEYEVGLEVSYKISNWLEIMGDSSYDGDKNSYSAGVEIEKTIILEKPLTSNSNPYSSNSWMDGKVFMDDNNNGEYDSGEVLLEGIEVNVGRKKGVTDKDGAYFIDHISSYEKKEFKINLESLDPMLQAGNNKKYIKLYPATGGHIDVPIQIISMIMGNVKFPQNNLDAVKKFPIISQLYVKLKTLDGKLIKEQRLESEGFYMLEDVLPGNYILEMDYRGDGKINFEEKSKKLNIKMDKYGSYYEDYDFKIISYEKE